MAKALKWAIAGSCIMLGLALLAGCGGGAPPPGPLDWSMGSWHGVRRATDDGSEATILVRVEALPGGPGVIERLEVSRQDPPYVGFTVRVHDPDSGGWLMLYANSSRKTISRLEGSIEGSRSTWQSVTPGGTRDSRLVSERLEANRWRRTQYVSDDGGTSWRVLFTDDLERDK